MRRYFLRKREARSLLEEASKSGIRVPPAGKARVEVAEEGDIKLFLLSGRPVLAERKGQLVPLLTEPELSGGLPAVVVDMGAVPHICNGADVMAPGIVELRGDFGPGSLVRVVDERHGKTIAIGRALYGSEEIRSMERGKVVKSLHYVGDRIWRLARALSA